MPSWIPKDSQNPIFRSYLSGLIAAEGCVRLYNNHGIADACLTITLNKPLLLGELSNVIGGRLYDVKRAWRLVIYGRPAVALLHHLDLRHEEKVKKSSLLLDHRGKQWSDIEHLWRELVESIRIGVKGPTAGARLDYIVRYGAPHPNEIQHDGRS